MSSISPSATSLLVLKSQTAIPFARAAAESLLGADGLARELDAVMKLAGADLRRHHFEARYRSIDVLLEAAGATRILELGSGLSFRGLALAERQPVHYLDTDLPSMVATKVSVLERLRPATLAGTYRVEPLDALDAHAFRAAAASLPAGPSAVVNEGLLMYLDEERKARVAANVRAALAARGGVWITADVYLQGPPDPRVEQSERQRRFFAEHRIEENKFAGVEAAERFFAEAGFVIVRRLPARGRESWMLAVAAGA